MNLSRHHVSNRAAALGPGSQHAEDLQVPFVPVEVADAITIFDLQVSEQALKDFYELEDSGLIDRLIDAGFTPLSLAALELAPLAFVAWASDEVTNKENEAVVVSVYRSRLSANPLAMSYVQSWLDQRPPTELWELWQDFTCCRLRKFSTPVRQAIGDRLLEQAREVAAASGGFCGFGKICAAEQRVLDAIEALFYEY